VPVIRPGSSSSSGSLAKLYRGKMSRSQSKSQDGSNSDDPPFEMSSHVSELML